MSESPSEILTSIEEAADGLVYTSESDRPFEPFRMNDAAGRWPLDAQAFGKLVGIPPGQAVEERSLHDFFSRHIENTDPYDVETQKIRPRYEALRDMLQRKLKSVRVFRSGKIEVKCWVVGGDGEGGLVGLQTVAIET